MSIKRDDRFGVGYLLADDPSQTSSEAAGNKIARDALEAVTSGLSFKVLAAVKAHNGGETDIRQLVDATDLDYEVVVPLVRWLEGKHLLTTSPDKYGNLHVKAT